MVSAIVHGFLLAFGLILPLGVQNVFVFNQGVTQPKFTRALPVIITASLCDTLLITLAVLGVSVVVFSFPLVKISLLSVGILFLVYMGIATWKSDPVDSIGEKKAFTPKKQIAFAASVSLLNPHAILDTIGVIGTSSLSYSGMDKVGFSAAAIIVSWLWFFGLALAGRQVDRADPKGNIARMLNKVSALVIWGTAVYLLMSLIQ